MENVNHWHFVSFNQCIFSPSNNVLQLVFMLKFVVANFEGKVSVGIEDIDRIGHFYHMRNIYIYIKKRQCSRTLRCQRSKATQRCKWRLFNTYSSCLRGSGERGWLSSYFQQMNHRLVLVTHNMWPSQPSIEHFVKYWELRPKEIEHLSKGLLETSSYCMRKGNGMPLITHHNFWFWF